MGESGKRLAWVVALGAGLTVAACVASAGAATTSSLPVHQSPGDPQACKGCHSSEVTGMVAGAPSGNRICYSCHVGTGTYTIERTLFEQGAHGPMRTTKSGTPVARGDGGSAHKGLCVNCHDPHEQSPGRSLTWLGTEQDSTALCVSCHLDTHAYGAWPGPRVYAESPHGNLLTGAKRTKSQWATGECLNCHDPHGKGNQRLLVGARGSDFCLASGCHDQSVATGLWPGKNAYQSANGVHGNPPAVAKTGVRLTYPGRDAAAGSCATCHAPHGAVDPATGGLTPGMTNATGAELCYQCHPDLRFTFSSLSHHRVDEPGTELTCTTCHNPHTVRRLGEVVSDPDRPTNAMAADNTFCLKCHDGSFGLAVDIRRELATAGAAGSFANAGKNLHYYHVTQNGARCTDCHEAHGSNNRSLIRQTIQLDLPGYPGKDGCSGGPAGAICH